jgi:hypothetical protein
LINPLQRDTEVVTIATMPRVGWISTHHANHRTASGLTRLSLRYVLSFLSVLITLYNEREIGDKYWLWNVDTCCRTLCILFRCILCLTPMGG